jgi:membrane associated rhomboid family serine protease
VAVFYYQTTHPDFTSGYSAVPKEITTNTDLVGDEMIQMRGEMHPIPQTPGPSPIFLTLFTAMFMHGSLMHLGSNMLFLWIFGDNVELRFGTFMFIFFYVVSGLVASLTHIMLAPNSIIPSLGASGAIAGVLGAYLVLFPRNRVNTLFFVKIISIPAFAVIGLWGVMQVVTMMGQTTGESGGVAYAAHVGGLVTGMILGLAFRFILEKEPESVLAHNYEKDPKAKKLW